MKSWNFTLPSWGLVDVDFINPLTGFILSNFGEVYRTRDGGITGKLLS